MTILTDRRTASTTGGLAFFYDLAPPSGDFKADVLESLSATPKTLSPKYLYDERGSDLFERVTETEDYYPTRTELGILERAASTIAEMAGPNAAVIEPGAGASVKIRMLLDALNAPSVFCGLDISGDHLRGALANLAADYPQLRIGGVCADFTHPIAAPGEVFDGAGRRLIFFPGSTIGNFEPTIGAAILKSLRGLVRPGDLMVIGVDVVKEVDTLERAYDDRDGVTAMFIANILKRLKNELGASVNLDGFDYEAVWNAELSRIEMNLVSAREQVITLADHVFTLKDGERISVSQSRKYTVEGFTAFAGEAGFAPECVWTDARGWFALHVMRAV